MLVIGAAPKPGGFVLPPTAQSIVDVQSLPPAPSLSPMPFVDSMFTIRNVAIGGGIALAAYLAYELLKSPKKKPAAAPMIAGLGWFFKRRRKRSRRR